MGKYDLAAFIEKVVEIKLKEIKEAITTSKADGSSPLNYFALNYSEEELEKEILKRLKITYVGHSMGGKMLPIYVIERKLAQKPHYLNEAVLLAPAGFHTIGKVSNQGHLLGIACWSFPKLTDHISIPDCLVGPT